MTNNGFFFSLENKKSRGKQLVILGHLLENAIGVGDGPGFSVFLFFCVDFSLCWSSLFCCCYKMATITLKIMSVFKAGEKEHDSTSHISLLNQGGQSTNHPYPPTPGFLVFPQQENCFELFSNYWKQTFISSA